MHVQPLKPSALPSRPTVTMGYARSTETLSTEDLVLVARVGAVNYFDYSTVPFSKAI